VSLLNYLSFICSFQLDELIGKKITVTLSGVRDLAGNVQKKSLMWSFVMQDFGAKQATVTVSGMKLQIPYTQGTNSSIIASLRASLASSLGISESRLTNFVASPSDDGKTLFSFDILPPGSTASREDSMTASEIAAMISSIDFSQDSFLNQHLSSDSVV
jgi:hypothetical protein